MILFTDEGFTDGEMIDTRSGAGLSQDALSGAPSIREREELAYNLLASLPRSSLATVQRRIAPLLQLDVVGLLPDEVALNVLSFLPWSALLQCSLVSRRWHALSNDTSLWKSLCLAQKWEWRTPPNLHATSAPGPGTPEDLDDEGMGDEERDDDAEDVTSMLVDDSGFSSMSVISHSLAGSSSAVEPHVQYQRSTDQSRHRLPIPCSETHDLRKPNYKLLHNTHMRLRSRMLTSSYNLSALQSRGSPNGHSNTIYCLQLYTYPDTGVQVLFTGSKDRTIREWDLKLGVISRVIEGLHTSSVLSICVHNGLLASGGSDHKVVVWDLTSNSLVTVIHDHEDSVLCVRFDEHRLVSCSKDRTVRTYLLPGFTKQYVLGDHRAAVNAVSISQSYIVSASGDRSMRLWDAHTGALLRTFETHHGRGIASIDFKPPFVLSGSSDKHLRMLDISTSQGWSTSPDFDKNAATTALAQGAVCDACGSTNALTTAAGEARPTVRQRTHEDLVRSVALSDDFVVSGSYDCTVKVWDRKTGALVADLTGGHMGRVFCVAFDCTKIVSCGEDQRICIWDFSHGIDTSFIKL